jgi:hypothetical protein
VKETVSPHTMGAGLDFAAGQSAVSSTKLLNQSSGTTATHTSLIATFSKQVQVDSISVFNNGVKVSSPSCSPALSSLPTNAVANGDGTFSVMCSNIGNTSGGKSARMLVQFSAATSLIGSSITVFGTATYGESGNDHTVGPNGTVNDRQRSAPDTVNVIDAAATFAQGKCTTTNYFVSGGDSTLTTEFTYAAVADQGLAGICTPAASGVIPGSKGVHSEIAFFDVPTLAGGTTPLGGLATLKLVVTRLVGNWQTAPLYEDVSAAQDFSKFITVPDCNSDGTPPSPGVPPAAATNTTPQINDACIYHRGPAPMSGGEFDLHVFGSLFDSRFTT